MDLGNVVDSRDFLLATSFASFSCTIGRSSFVGMGVIVLLYPLPGYVVKLILAVQRRLKKTDLRVQAITETSSALDYLKTYSEWTQRRRDRAGMAAHGMGDGDAGGAGLRVRDEVVGEAWVLAG
ncbi:hypothetical protein B0H14DRAFT_2624880 [Mycena olivaceomarginata]|nr:hypothetical protein B0H14DRAFT_2624880 [Mycena olivaceomarginata]